MKWIALLLTLALCGCTKTEASIDCSDLAKGTPGMAVRSVCQQGEHVIASLKMMSGEHEGEIAKITTPRGMVCCAKDKTNTEEKSPSPTAWMDCENLFGAKCKDKCDDGDIQTPAVQVPEDAKLLPGKVVGLICRAITNDAFELLSNKGITLQKDGKTLAFSDSALETKRVCCLDKRANK